MRSNQEGVNDLLELFARLCWQRAGGASHWFAEACVVQNLEFSFWFHIDHRVRDGIMMVPTGRWHHATDSNGERREGAEVAELTEFIDLKSWPARLGAAHRLCRSTPTSHPQDDPTPHAPRRRPDHTQQPPPSPRPHLTLDPTRPRRHQPCPHRLPNTHHDNRPPGSSSFMKDPGSDLDTISRHEGDRNRDRILTTGSAMWPGAPA